MINFEVPSASMKAIVLDLDQIHLDSHAFSRLTLSVLGCTSGKRLKSVLLAGIPTSYRPLRRQLILKPDSDDVMIMISVSRYLESFSRRSGKPASRGWEGYQDIVGLLRSNGFIRRLEQFPPPVINIQISIDVESVLNFLSFDRFLLQEAKR